MIISVTYLRPIRKKSKVFKEITAQLGAIDSSEKHTGSLWTCGVWGRVLSSEQLRQAQVPEDDGRDQSPGPGPVGLTD